MSASNAPSTICRLRELRRPPRVLVKLCQGSEVGHGCIVPGSDWSQVFSCQQST